MRKAIVNNKLLKTTSKLMMRYSPELTICCPPNVLNQKRDIGLVLVSSLIVSSVVPLWKIWKQLNETRQILKKADESIRWPFAQGVVKSAQLEEGKILFGLTNAYKLNIKYEYKLGTSEYYQKHPSGLGYRKIDTTLKRVPLDDEKDSNLFIPLMPPAIDPEEPLVITSGKPRLFDNDRVFWTVPYWLIGGQEMKNNLLKMAEEFKKDEETLVRINPIDPRDSVLIVGRQSFDQSWRFTYIYISVMALISVLIFATSYFTLISIVGEFEIEIPNLKDEKANVDSSNGEKFSSFLWGIVWYLNESYRLFSSIVLNRHGTEALPPNKNKKPNLIDVNDLKEEKN